MAEGVGGKPQVGEESQITIEGKQVSAKEVAQVLGKTGSGLGRVWARRNLSKALGEEISRESLGEKIATMDLETLQKINKAYNEIFGSRPPHFQHQTKEMKNIHVKMWKKEEEKTLQYMDAKKAKELAAQEGITPPGAAKAAAPKPEAPLPKKILKFFTILEQKTLRTNLSKIQLQQGKPLTFYFEGKKVEAGVSENGTVTINHGGNVITFTLDDPKFFEEKNTGLLRATSNAAKKQIGPAPLE